MNKLIRLFEIVLMIILGLLVLVGNIYNGILLSIISVSVIVLFVKKVKIKRFGIFLILFSFITKLAAIFVLKPQIMADFWIMYAASQSMLQGDFSVLNSLYFNTWGYQLFHVFYEFFLFKIFNDVIIVKIMNVIYSTVITYLLYKICKKFVSEEASRITSLIYAISIYPVYLNTILGNQQLSLMLFLIGVYILLYKKDSRINLVLIGILFGLSNLERPEGIVFITTLFMYYLISNKKFKTWIINFLIIFFSYFIITFGSNLVFKTLHYNEVGFDNKNVYWKFVTGFNYNTFGKYDGNDEYYINVLHADECKKEAFRRIKMVNKWPRLFYEKIKIQWLYSDLDESLQMKNNGIISGKLINCVIEYVRVMNIFCYILVFIGLFKNNKLKDEYKFFLMYILVNFGVYLLIEVHLRYYYNPQIAIMVLGSIGIERLLNHKFKV